MNGISARKSTIAAVAAGVAAVALLAWAFAPRPVEVETATAHRGHFETTIDEDGKTRLHDRYVVSAPLAGRLARMTLREGDAVRAGDVVATLAPVLSPLVDERTLREQSVRVDVARAQRERAAVRIERAKVGLLQAQSEVRRTEQLAGQGFVSPNKLDNDRLALQAAQKELDTAVQDSNVADHEVEQARAALTAVRSPSQAVRSFELRAPVSGRVLRIHQPSETTVALGTPLVELGDTRSLEVVAELLTTDALQARPGSPVVIDRWGGPAPLQGRVRLVEPAAFTKVSALGVEEQRVEVLIDITSPPEQWAALGDGFRVGVRIVTQAVNDVLKVPVSTVFPLPQPAAEASSPARNAVFAVRDGRAQLVPVELAARNGEEAWLKQGLDPGTAVIVYPPPAVKDGQRVSARKV